MEEKLLTYDHLFLDSFQHKIIETAIKTRMEEKKCMPSLYFGRQNVHLLIDIVGEFFHQGTNVHVLGVLKKIATFVLLLSRLPKHLEKKFFTFLNSTAFVESKNNNIFILG